MQQVYRINVIAAYKPWRGSQTITIADKSAFEHVAGQSDKMFHDMSPPWTKTATDEDYSMYEWLDTVDANANLPYILLDEVTVYTE